MKKKKSKKLKSANAKNNGGLKNQNNVIKGFVMSKESSCDITKVFLSLSN